jgi:ATP-binding cassette subfamily B multidrug efflux pump
VTEPNLRYIYKVNQKDLSFPLLWEILFTRPWARLSLLALSFFGTLFGIMGPFFQKEFVDRLTNQPLILNIDIHPLGYLALSFISILASLGLAQLVTYLGAREAILMQRVLAQRLYNKTLELRSDTLSGRPIGELVSIYTTDIPGATILLEQSFPQGCGIFFPLVLAPLALIKIFKIPFTSTLVLICSLIGLSLLLAYKQSRYFYRFKRLAADRVGIANEWIQNIRTLRILGWVREFEKKITSVRKVETKNRIAMLNNGQSMNAISSSATFLLNVTAVSAIVASTTEKISSGTLMALMWIVAIFLTRPFRMLPWFFTFLFDSWTSIRRVAAIYQLHNSNPHVRDPDFRKLQDLGAPDPAIQIKNLNLSIQNEPLLKNISMHVDHGEFLAIVGEVGSGKSLLLLSLLGETGASYEVYNVGKNDARTIPLDQLRQFFTFVPQEGFIMSATLRENVGFDYDIETKNDIQILQSLKRSQFNWRQERMAQGLDTEIGERGVNMSGGQKQRVSLARVDYFTSPIVLLDDCLSAVDVDTENKLIKSLFVGSWKHRTRILVTHRLTVLDKVDRILFLENGQISAEGTFTELMENHASFRDYAATIQKKSAEPAPVTDLELGASDE